MEEINALDIVARMLVDRTFRKTLVSESLFWFSHFYFPDAFNLPTADFQKEIMGILESEQKGLVVIAAARKSGKSTVACEHYPLYEILARKRRKSVVILSRTQRQAQDHLANIKRDLENPANILLIQDWGPFKEVSDQWGTQTLVFPRLGARITTASTEQSIRGMRYRASRPDLIICDDIEDGQSVAKVENRDKIDRWLNEDVIPAGGENARIIFLGTPLHEDSVMMRLRKAIESGEREGIFGSYPIIDDKGVIAWPGRYPTMEAVEEERRKVNDRSWRQEYLLQIVSEEDQIINPEWLRYYKTLLDRSAWTGHRFRIISVDPAISEKDSADCTAIVSAEVYGSGKELKIFILPNPINRRGMTAKETVQCVKKLADEVTDYYGAKVVIESVAMQLVFAQMMRGEGIRDVIEVAPGRQDKRTRLSLAGYYMQNGQIYFPENGVKDLTSELLNFGRGRYDDLADAFSQLVLNAAELTKKSFVIPGNYYPESSYLGRYLAKPEEAEMFRKEAEAVADRDLIKKDEEKRKLG